MSSTRIIFATIAGALCEATTSLGSAIVGTAILKVAKHEHYSTEAIKPAGIGGALVGGLIGLAYSLYRYKFPEDDAQVQEQDEDEFSNSYRNNTLLFLAAGCASTIPSVAIGAAMLNSLVEMSLAEAVASTAIGAGAAFSISAIIRFLEQMCNCRYVTQQEVDNRESKQMERNFRRSMREMEESKQSDQRRMQQELNSVNLRREINARLLFGNSLNLFPGIEQQASLSVVNPPIGLPSPKPENTNLITEALLPPQVLDDESNNFEMFRIHPE